MGLIREFREFAMKGNVVDMAVGIIIGGAFGKIVTSIVGDIIMPVIGALQKTGGSIGSRFLWLGSGEKPASLEAAKQSGEAYVAWGPFVQTTIDFLIVAFAIFMMLKVMNTAKSKMERKVAEAPAAPPAPSEEVLLLREIRDSLKAQ